MTKKDIINLANRYFFEIDDAQIALLLQEFELIEKHIIILNQFQVDDLPPTFLNHFAKNNFFRPDGPAHNENKFKLLLNSQKAIDQSLVIIAHQKSSQKPHGNN